MGSPNKRTEILNLFMRNQLKYKGYAYTLALDWAVAEDAVQEAAVFICDHFDQFELGTNFDAWARTIIKNRCREIFRKEHREKDKASKIAEVIPEEIWDQAENFDSEKLRALHICLEGLPRQTKEAVKRFYGESQKCNFISQSLKMSEEAVYKLLSRVRKSLKTCIQSHLKEAIE